LQVVREAIPVASRSSDGAAEAVLKIEPPKIDSPTKVPLADSTAMVTNIPLPVMSRINSQKPTIIGTAHSNIKPSVMSLTSVGKRKITAIVNRSDSAPLKKVDTKKATLTRNPSSSQTIRGTLRAGLTSTNNPTTVSAKGRLTPAANTTESTAMLHRLQHSRIGTGPGARVAASVKAANKQKETPAATDPPRLVARPLPAGNTGPQNRPEWDTKGRLQDIETAYTQIHSKFDSMTSEKDNIVELLLSERSRRTTTNEILTADI
jgi:hypothetical protein